MSDVRNVDSSVIATISLVVMLEIDQVPTSLTCLDSFAAEEAC